jgi:hypothetical protein
MAKITRLTTEQKNDLRQHRDKWLAVGLSVEPVDREAAKSAVASMYECAGLKPPSKYIFLSSPMRGAIVSATLVEAQVRAQVWDQAWDQVRDQVRAQVGDHVRDQVWDQVGDQVGAPVGAQVWDQVRAQVGAQVGAQVRPQVGRAVYGSQDAGWLSFYSYFTSHFGLAEKAKGLISVAENCGWVWPFENIAIVTDRPDRIVLADGILHSETGPAIRYRDGFAVYAWNGVRVPGRWIEDKDTIGAEEILSCENVEQRAAGISIIGMARVLDSLDHEIIDSDPNPLHGDLIAIRIPDIPERVFYLRAQCPRNGTIMEPVNPDEMDEMTVHAAQAWRVGLPSSEFVYPTVRT